jgi:acetylornithine deacetylase
MNVADLTKELVSIPSHRADDHDESAAGAFIESWLREETTGDVERDTAGNVIARKGSGSPSLALVGHHDVVPPDDSQRDGESYVIERDGDRLYGRGTADMKGSLAAAMLAFRDADPAKGELIFASFTGEEQGGIGCQAAIEDGFAPEYAIVGEGSTGYSAPGVTDVAIAHKGRRGSTIIADGKAAHASETDAGENAIYRATEAVTEIRTMETPTATVLGHDLQGSLTVTEIEGGSAWNVVPERCVATVDERTVPDARAPVERIEEIPGVSWRVDQDLPPMACRAEQFAEVVHEAANRAQDGTPEHIVKPHATDAGWLARAGTSCVVVGAAEPGQAHTATESVSIPVVERCRRIYAGGIDGWLG